MSSCSGLFCTTGRMKTRESEIPPLSGCLCVQRKPLHRMLSQLRSAAGPNTKLLIGDMLLPYACDSDDAFVREDSPILPNLGVANVHGYLIDIMVRLAVYLGMRAAR